MKQKKINKKLGLNKSTVAHLGNNIMAEAKGGNLWVSHMEPSECCASANCTELACDSFPGACNTGAACNTNSCTYLGC